MSLSHRFLTGAMLAATMALSPARADVRAGVEAWQRGNYPAAIREWRPLAEKGDADAQFNLAQAYKLGRGVPADLKVAQGWYEKAARQNHEEAQANLGLILFQNGEQEAGMVWIRKAADNGDPRARYVLATALFNGDMMARDWPLAYALMSRAAAQGVEPAADSLAQMENLLPESQRQQGMRLLRELARKDADRDIAAGRMAPIASAPPPVPTAPSALPAPAPEPAQVATVPTEAAPTSGWSPPEESVTIASATTSPPTTPAVTPTWSTRKSRQRPQRSNSAPQPAAAPPPPAPVAGSSPPPETPPSIPTNPAPTMPPSPPEQVAVASPAAKQGPAAAAPTPTELVSSPPPDKPPSIPTESAPATSPPSAEPVTVASAAASQEAAARPAPTERASSPPPDTPPPAPAESVPATSPPSAEPVAVASATPPLEAAAAGPQPTELASIGRAAAPPPAPPKPVPASPPADPAPVSAKSGPVTAPAKVSSIKEPVAPASATPAKKPAAPATKPAAPAPRIATGGRWRVQFGAYASLDLAKGRWTMLRKKIGLLGGLQPSYETFGGFTRLRVNSLADRSAAEKLCAAAEAAGQGCFAIAP